MPIPTPNDNESQEQFIDRCMIDETMVAEYDDDQRLAICIAQIEEERAISDIDFTPTQAMIENAKQGLEWREEFGRGGTDVGVGTANAIIDKKITADRTKRMFSYLSRHEVDKDAEGFNSGEDGFPSAGRIAWELWGGDEAFTWSADKVKEMNKEEEKEQKQVFIVMGASCSGKSTYVRNNANEKDLVFDFDNVHQAISNNASHIHIDNLKRYVFDVRDALYERLKKDKSTNAWIINSSPLKQVRSQLVEELDAKIIYIKRSKEECLRIAENERPQEWREYIENYFERFEDFAEDEDITIVTMEENKLENAPQELRTNPEKEIRTFNVENLELRQEGDDNVVVGYGSVFNTLSNELGGFREIISEGAFDGRLEDDVRFLINHDGLPLARTTNGTLRLSTDERGLKYEAKVANTSLGRDLVELMRNGTINQSSFAFVVEDDSWEVKDGMNVRTINKVSRLYDVSAVTYPAYEEASVALRSMEAWKQEEEEKVMKDNLEKEKEERSKEDLDLTKRSLAELRLSIINKK